jgi:hypothetical protein
VIWRIAFFIGATASVWVGVALVCRNWWGDAQAVGSGIAALVCLVPGVVTLLWSELALKWSPTQQVTAVLGGTAVRVFVVATVAFALFQQVEFLRREGEESSGFWNWVLIFYFITLALEVTTLLWAQAAIARKAPQGEPKESGEPVTAPPTT